MGFGSLLGGQYSLPSEQSGNCRPFMREGLIGNGQRIPRVLPKIIPF